MNTEADDLYVLDALPAEHKKVPFRLLIRGNFYLQTLFLLIAVLIFLPLSIMQNEMALSVLLLQLPVGFTQLSMGFIFVLVPAIKSGQQALWYLLVSTAYLVLLIANAMSPMFGEYPEWVNLAGLFLIPWLLATWFWFISLLMFRKTREGA